MEKERSQKTEKMLNLTLELIYLLTGENYIAFKLSDGLVASNMTKTQNPVIDPPSHSLRKNRKVEEVTREIIELLTGEVHIRRQDVAVYFSMEEWEYVEGHKELYKDVMMASQPALTSPDGSSNRNAPERCPRPLYSRDSTQEHQGIPQEDQSGNFIKIAVKEELYVINDGPHTEEIEVPPEISTDTRATQTDLKPKEEEEGPHPLYSWDFTQEHREVPQDGENKNLIRNKDKSEESYSRGDKPWKDDISAEISTDEQNPDNRPFISPCGDIEVDDITLSFSGERPITTNLNPTTCVANLLSNPSTLSNDPPPIIYHAIRRVSEKFPCSICGKSFTAGNDLVIHQRKHLLESQYTCSICGEGFSRKLRLIEHKQSHLEKKRCSCSKCGKYFNHEGGLRAHQKTHNRGPPN